MSFSDEQIREENIRDLVHAMPDEQRKAYSLRCRKAIKDPDTYAVLNYLFIAGLHHFYLGRWVRGLINLSIFSIDLILFVAGIALASSEQSSASGIFFTVGVILAVGITIVEVYALLRSQYIVLRHNNDVSESIIHEITSS